MDGLNTQPIQHKRPQNVPKEFQNIAEKRPQM